jgi:hypothetical protein
LPLSVSLLTSFVFLLSLLRFPSSSPSLSFSVFLHRNYNFNFGFSNLSIYYSVVRAVPFVILGWTPRSGRGLWFFILRLPAARSGLCLGVWVFGCLGVWVFGCLGVWVFGCSKRMHIGI